MIVVMFIQPAEVWCLGRMGDLNWRVTPETKSASSSDAAVSRALLIADNAEFTTAAIRSDIMNIVAYQLHTTNQITITR